MKKILVAVLTAVLCISLLACSNGSKDSAEKPSGNATYTNNEYGISLEFPSTWKPNKQYTPPRFEGSDGFFLVAATAGGPEGIDGAADAEANHVLKPYGSNPTIEKLTIAGQDARLIMPSDDQSADMKGQAGLIVKYPNPITIKNQTYKYFVLWADKDHIKNIGESVKFTR